MEKKYNKVVLAYSGGLDTSVTHPVAEGDIMAAKSSRFPAMSVRAQSWTVWKKKAVKTGASKLIVLDLKKTFVDDYIIPTMKAGAQPTSSTCWVPLSLVRSSVRNWLGSHWKKVQMRSATAATGKGNDQVRFELAIHAFAPQMDIIAPWRFWAEQP